MNNNIINILLLLKNKIEDDIKINDNDDLKTITSYQFKLKTIKHVISMLKKYKKKITTENVNELLEYPGIGKKSVDKIIEILKTGTLTGLNDNTKNIPDNNKIILELTSIIGIGEKSANFLIQKGILSIEDLKQKINDKSINVNNKIKLGIKYHGKFMDNIPRKEISDIDKIINYISKNNNNKIYFKHEICGSYRREHKFCGDIDILITNNEDLSDFNYLKFFVNLLKNQISLNNNNPLIIEDITNKSYKNKYMGFLKYRDNFIRRVDIVYMSPKYYYSSLLYFTGSVDFNKKMRIKAKKLNYILSEYGLYNIISRKMLNNFSSEKEIFNKLDMEYIEPKNRD